MKDTNEWIRICFLIGCVCFLSRFAQKQTDTFTISAITSNRPYNEAFSTRPLTKEEAIQLETALKQPYTYFGRGGQAFTFFSADGKYVIKFFKQRLFRPPYLLNHLPLPSFLHRYRFKRNWKRQDKLERDFFSYKAAFEELQEETGVIYTHLNPTTHLNQTLEIVDRLGIHHFLSLDNFDFIVQKRGEKVYDRIDALMKKNDVASAKAALQQVFSLILTRAKKGFRDRDPNIRTNCGFLGERAIKIDVGRFVRQEEMKKEEVAKEDLLRITAPFKSWIQEHHPTLLPIYQSELNEALAQ